MTASRIVARSLTPTRARRLADLATALEPDFGPVTIIDAAALELVAPEPCGYCGWPLEGGHCYTCRPVMGYGEGRAPVVGSRARP